MKFLVSNISAVCVFTTLFASPVLAGSLKFSCWNLSYSNQAANLALTTALTTLPPDDGDQTSIDADNLAQFACVLGVAGNKPRAKLLLKEALTLMAPPRDDSLTRMIAIQAYMLFDDKNDAILTANVKTYPAMHEVFLKILTESPSCDPSAGNKTVPDDLVKKPANWDYKSAVRTANSENPEMGIQDLARVVESAAASNNLAAAAYAVPYFMNELKAVPKDDAYYLAVEDELIPATDALAEAGMKNEAAQPYAALKSAMQDPSWMNGQQSEWMAQFAPVQAAMGDLRSALQSANLAGSIDDDSYQNELTAITTMSFDDPKSNPSPSEIVNRIEKLGQVLPKGGSWQKSDALQEIVSTYARMGDLRKAEAVETLLEVETSNSSENGYRDDALAAIAEAQTRAGNPVAALATIGRINDSLGRWPPLIELAATPDKP